MLFATLRLGRRPLLYSDPNSGGRMIGVIPAGTHVVLMLAKEATVRGCFWARVVGETWCGWVFLAKTEFGEQR